MYENYFFWCILFQLKLFCTNFSTYFNAILVNNDTDVSKLMHSIFLLYVTT